MLMSERLCIILLLRQLAGRKSPRVEGCQQARYPERFKRADDAGLLDQYPR
jgi:hypothetical protein